ncbi:hypothetical protein [Dactylosporangium salmoneum]|uniref:hypothetical protein n=1 Tax=Dactylosporangium salmoneum TaxID=53361 RepID=UPI0031E06CDD
MHLLQTMAEHRPVDLGEDVLADLDNTIGSDAEDVRVVGGLSTLLTEYGGELTPASASRGRPVSTETVQMPSSSWDFGERVGRRVRSP